DQAMRLGSHVRQFGNDLFLLRKIERHCFLRTGPMRAPARANPSSDLRILFLRIRRHLPMPTWWPFQEKPVRAAPSAQALRFETFAMRCGLSVAVKRFHA